MSFTSSPATGFRKAALKVSLSTSLTKKQSFTRSGKLNQISEPLQRCSRTPTIFHSSCAAVKSIIHSDTQDALVGLTKKQSPCSKPKTRNWNKSNKAKKTERLSLRTHCQRSQSWRTSSQKLRCKMLTSNNQTLKKTLKLAKTQKVKRKSKTTTNQSAEGTQTCYHL